MLELTFRLAVGDSRLEAWAVAEAGSEVWVEVDLPGLAEPAQCTTKRQAAAPAVGFGFVLELPAGAGSSAQEALREALAGGDEEDADLTFTLKAPGPRKKPKEVASGYVNLRAVLSAGKDLVSATVALLGKDDSPAGSLTVSLTAVDALRAAASPAPAQTPAIAATDVAEQASANSRPASRPISEQADVASAPAADAGASDVVEQMEPEAGAAGGAESAVETTVKPSGTQVVEAVSVPQAETAAGAVEAGVAPAEAAAGAAPEQPVSIPAEGHVAAGAPGNSDLPPATAACCASGDPHAEMHISPPIPPPAAAAAETAAAATPAADATQAADAPAPAFSELSVETPDSPPPPAGVRGEASVRTPNGSAVDASVDGSGTDGSRTDASRTDGSRLLTPRARQRVEEERAAAAAGEPGSSTARRAAARAAHKASLKALVGLGRESDVEETEGVKPGVKGGGGGAVKPGVKGDGGGVPGGGGKGRSGADADNGDGVNEGVYDTVKEGVKDGVNEGVPGGAAGAHEGLGGSLPPPQAPPLDDWRLGVTADEARLMLPASGRRYKLRLRVGGGDWSESRASRPSGHSHLNLDLVRRMYVGPGSRAHGPLVAAVGQRTGDAEQEGVEVQLWVMEAVGAEGAREPAGASGWRVLAAGAMSWRQVMAQVRVEARRAKGREGGGFVLRGASFVFKG